MRAERTAVWMAETMVELSAVLTALTMVETTVGKLVELWVENLAE